MKNEKRSFDELIIDYFSGTISEIDQICLFDLIKLNKDFKNQFDEMLKLHAISSIPALEAKKKTNYSNLIQQINDVPSIKLTVSWVTYFRRIASVILLVVSVSLASFYIYRDIYSKTDTLSYETIVPIGSQSKIVLPDSTVVWLNSGSSLKYSQSFGKKNREVALKGEGYFEVRNDKSKPFIVHANSLDVNVMGTVFNVRAYKEDADIEVNLIEGIVNISLPELKGVGAMTLKPNEKLVFNKRTKKIESFHTDASRSALWTTGKLCFVDATIEQISKDLERKYNVKIRILSNKIKNEIFSGSLNLNLSLKDVLTYIDVDKKFKYSQTGDTISIDIK